MMTYDRLTRWNACWGLVLLAVIGLAAAPRTARAQAAWLQNVQVIAPVDPEAVTGVLLDSLAGALERSNVPVHRGPNAPATTLTNVQQQLQREGLGVRSATHVFITYRFRVTSAGTKYKIMDLYFIFRPPNGNEEDIPVLYLDLTDPETYEAMLVENGTTLAYNEAAFLQFRDQVSFHSMSEQVRVVQVGKQIIRDAKLAAAEKQRILAITTQFTYR